MSHVPGELWIQPNNLIPFFKSVHPDNTKKSYVITLLPLMNAYTKIYNSVKPNGVFIFDHYWNIGQHNDKGARDFLGFLGRKVRHSPLQLPNFVPSVNLFPNANMANDYLRAQKVEHKQIPEGNALVVISDLSYQFPVSPALTTIKDPRAIFKALKFTTGFKVLRSQTVDRFITFQLPTTDPRVIINIRETYEPFNPQDPYQPVFNFLRFREARLFGYDITDQYASLTIPMINTTIKEYTEHLKNMYLLRVNMQTNNTDTIVIRNTVQHTKIVIDQMGLTAKSTSETIEPFQYVPMVYNNGYVVSESFMMWVEHLDIQQFPIFIGYFNKYDSWVRQ